MPVFVRIPLWIRTLVVLCAPGLVHVDDVPEPGVKAGRRPPGGLGLDVGEDLVILVPGGSAELVTVGVLAGNGSACRCATRCQADMRGLVTAGPCVRLE